MNPLLETTTQSWSSTILVMVMLVAIYGMLIIPQRKRTKNEERMRANIEIGDEVITIGGIIGIVVGMKEEALLIETGSDRMRLRVLRGAISRNVTAEEREAAAKGTKESKKKESKKIEPKKEPEEKK